jgi:hypothetical protein
MDNNNNELDTANNDAKLVSEHIDERVCSTMKRF